MLHIFITRVKPIITRPICRCKKLSSQSFSQTIRAVGTLWNCKGCPVKQEASICHSGSGDNGAKWLFSNCEFHHFSTWSFAEPSFKDTVAQDWTTLCCLHFPFEWPALGSTWVWKVDVLAGNPELLRKLCWGCKTISINTATNISLLSRMNTEHFHKPPKSTQTQDNLITHGIRLNLNAILMLQYLSRHWTISWGYLASTCMQHFTVISSEDFQGYGFTAIVMAHLLSIESDNAAWIYQRRCRLLSTWWSFCYWNFNKQLPGTVKKINNTQTNSIFLKGCLFQNIMLTAYCSYREWF